jgi:hypothetical protein
MTEQIITRTHIRAKARRDFAAGQSRDEHDFNWHAACLFEYFDEFDRLVAMGKASQESHIAPAERRHIDLRQAEVVS